LDGRLTIRNCSSSTASGEAYAPLDDVFYPDTFCRYAVDSLVLLLQSVIAAPAFREFGDKGYDKGLTISVYIGMLVGALFWGLSADALGRRLALNISLLICSVATIISGAMPNWASLGFFISLVGFGGGGNLVMDTTIFLEYLPGSKQWVLTLMAAWWGVGQAIAGFIAWGFLGKLADTRREREHELTLRSPGEVELRVCRDMHQKQQHGVALCDVH
jgi:MFS family permease